MKINPLVSVIVPAYNPDQSVYQTIQSVLNQTYKNFELVIINDGSEIDMIPIINRINDQRIIYHKLEHKNANVARNYGFYYFNCYLAAYKHSYILLTAKNRCPSWSAPINCSPTCMPKSRN
jgi:glycosyltransferase involved in cell wall biosynthesis